MIHRVYFSVCGEGYGHSTREMAIASRLEGAEVLFGSYGYVLDRIKQVFPVVEVGREFEMVGTKGSFNMAATVRKSGRSVLSFSRIISEEKKIMDKNRVTCVVVDGRTAAVFAAFQLGIPCIIVANQTSLQPFFENCSLYLHLLGKPVEFTMKTIVTLAEEVLIPDFPPPNSVCLPTLSRSRHVMKKQRFIGPAVGLEQPPEAQDIESPLVLTLLGGHPFRQPLFQSIIRAARLLPEVNFLVFTKFKAENPPQNVEIRGFADNIYPYMAAADLVVTQAGHSTAMELLTLGKPALIVPDQGQVEQECNAKRMKEIGVAETLTYKNLEEKSVCRKINMLLETSSYREKAEAFAEMAQRLDGAKRASDTILELSSRIQCY